MADERILIFETVDPDREALTRVLSARGFTTASAADLPAALSLLASFAPSVILLDAHAAELEHNAFLKQVRESKSDAAVVAMTAYGTLELAVDAMAIGADHYLIKPFDARAVMVVLEKALERRQLAKEADLLRNRVRSQFQITSMVGASAELRAVFEVVNQVAPTRATVLILGESGTGKELVAQALHDQSTRADKPYVRVNCAALSESLLESELFGHEKGAFTGALSRREGRFELANEGTLFLDEIAEISPALQVKLLRVLQSREFERVGGTETLSVDVRLLAATNRDLTAEVKAGRFREDLFYRLNVVSITVPPLRKRAADIPALVSHFIEKYSAVHGKKVTALAPGALGTLLGYPWPGNVRELENAIERAVVLCAGDEISLDDLPPSIRSSRSADPGTDLAALIPGAPLAVIEREAILRTLQMVEGSTARAAQVLGISVRKVQYRLREYGIHGKGASEDSAAPEESDLPADPGA